MHAQCLYARALLLALLGATPAVEAAVPTQFIAKMYTEALGRAPDPTGWSAAVEYFRENGCNERLLKTWGGALLASAEYASLEYDDSATTLVLYRAILDREPDAAGFNQWYSALQRGESVSAVAQAMLDSREFAELAPAICSGVSYSFELSGPRLAIAIPTPHEGGWGSLSEAQLQGLLDSTAPGETVYLQQESVVYLTQPLTIPGGVALATYGLPPPHRHALMARLVRAAPFSAPLVQINLDASSETSQAVRNLWIDGQRSAASGFVSDAINIEIYGGSGATVDSNFITNTLGWSNIHSFGSLDGLPCYGNDITNNVITAYSSVHAAQQRADGISAGCERSAVLGNQIVDPTDVGIVVFTAYPAAQESIVSDNIIVSAGNSAFGAMGFDPLQGRSAGAPDFRGAEISYNTFWSGPNSHFVIGLAVGTRPWFPQGSIGYGAEAIGNTTAGIRTSLGAGIVVSGMDSATVQENVLLAAPIPRGWTNCPIGNVLASVSWGLASGSIQSYSDVEVNGCMSDYSTPAQETPAVVMEQTAFAPSRRAFGRQLP